MDTKQDIRKLVFKRRKETELSYIEEASHAITERVLACPEYQACSWLYAYVDFNREVMTRELIEAAWRDGKRVAVPKCEGKDMIFYEITSFDQLKEGYFNILEPENCEKADGEDALMLMPGVAFDRQRHRVGYGGGFYDRYLEVHKKHTTAAVAFEFQLFDSVPYEELDIKPQLLITEREVIS